VNQLRKPNRGVRVIQTAWTISQEAYRSVSCGLPESMSKAHMHEGSLRTWDSRWPSLPEYPEKKGRPGDQSPGVHGVRPPCPWASVEHETNGAGKVLPSEP